MKYPDNKPEERTPVHPVTVKLYLHTEMDNEEVTMHLMDRLYITHGEIEIEPRREMEIVDGAKEAEGP